MRKASIDLGTNTCLLLIAECAGGEVRGVTGDYSTVVRLGKGVDQSKMLAPEAMERTLSCLKGYAEKVKAAGIEPAAVACVATSQARDARNGGEFFSRVEKETGFRFQVISGDEEARLTFLGGLLPGMDARQSAVIDIGGGSTEIISSHGGQSVDVGSVRFTERFLRSDPVTDEEFWACQKAIDDAWAPLVEWREKTPQVTEWVAVAGTATTLAAWFLGLASFDPLKINELELSRGDVHRMVEELKWRTIQERMTLPGMEAGRADVLLAGTLILWRAMELLRIQRTRISTRGLRYGALLKT